MQPKKTASDVDTDKKEVETPAMNAIELLKKDHRTVSALFKQFEETDEGEAKVALAQQICTELSIHAECEEKIFYPAARKALDEKSEDLVDEAAVEHRSLKALIAEIDGSSPDEQLFEANVTVLKEYVEHHVKEEEREMFPKLDGELDLDGLGAEIAEMKQSLKAKVGEPKTPRTGSKLVVHVPSLSGRPAAAKSKSSSAKSTSAKSKSSRHPSGAKSSTRSTAHSAH